jgi:hypothetical protein
LLPGILVLKLFPKTRVEKIGQRSHLKNKAIK